mgnify:FL=1
MTLIGIYALTSDGQKLEVEGVKMTKEDVELPINSVDIFAHIKSILKDIKLI